MIWKDIAGYENLYEVSNTGVVRTKEGKVTHSKKHGERKWKQRVLKEKNPEGRDVRVDLWKEGKPKSFLVHRLVAQAFIPVPDGKAYVNHIDGNPKNNNVENLEWCTMQENNAHALETGLNRMAKKVMLRNCGTKEVLEFSSMRKASEFLGKNKGFVSGAMAVGRTRVNGYELITEEEGSK